MLDLEQPEQAMAFWRGILIQFPGLTLSNGTPLHQAMKELAVDAGLQLENHNRQDSALKAYAEALKEDENYLPALLHRAWLLERLQRHAEARPLWEKALTLDPDAVDPSGTPVSNHVKPA